MYFQSVFYLIVFYVVTFALFIERFTYYSFMAEHTDLRKVMGLGGTLPDVSVCDPSLVTFSNPPPSPPANTYISRVLSFNLLQILAHSIIKSS